MLEELLDHTGVERKRMKSDGRGNKGRKDRIASISVEIHTYIPNEQNTIIKTVYS